jgi:hypothetical protein
MGLRLVWLVRRIGTPRREPCCKRLAAGTETARVIEEAKAALRFLDQRESRPARERPAP